MVNIVNQELTDSVVDQIVRCMKINYDMAVQLYRCGQHDLVPFFGKIFMQLLMKFCALSEYTPEGFSEEDVRCCEDGSASSSLYRKLLADPTVTVGLRNVACPMNVEIMYQILFDFSYRFIPLDQRPKDDFMNPPV